MAMPEAKNAELRAEEEQSLKREEAIREYEQQIARLFELIDDHVPAGDAVWMVSRGDNGLIRTNGRRMEHFPQTTDGLWGGHPTDDADAIAQVEALKARHGGGCLVFPAAATWWFDHYQGFRSHLGARYRVLADAENTGIIFEVRDQAWQRRLRAAVWAFQKRFERAPAILNWSSGLDVESLFPDLTVFAPPARASTLPYINRSIDIVICPNTAKAIGEARRVAVRLIVTTSGTTVRRRRRDGPVPSPTVRPVWLRRR